MVRYDLQNKQVLGRRVGACGCGETGGSPAQWPIRPYSAWTLGKTVQAEARQERADCV